MSSASCKKFTTFATSTFIQRQSKGVRFWDQNPLHHRPLSGGMRNTPVNFPKAKKNCRVENLDYILIDSSRIYTFAPLLQLLYLYFFKVPIYLHVYSICTACMYFLRSRKTRPSFFNVSFTNTAVPGCLCRNIHELFGELCKDKDGSRLTFTFHAFQSLSWSEAQAFCWDGPPMTKIIWWNTEYSNKNFQKVQTQRYNLQPIMTIWLISHQQFDTIRRPIGRFLKNIIPTCSRGNCSNIFLDVRGPT